MTIVRKLMMNEPQKFIAKFYLNSKTWQRYHHYVDVFMNETIRRQRHWRWKKRLKRSKRIAKYVVGVMFVVQSFKTREFLLLSSLWSIYHFHWFLCLLESTLEMTRAPIVWCRNLICDIIYYDCVYLNCVCQSNQSEVYDELSEIVFIVPSTYDKNCINEWMKKEEKRNWKTEGEEGNRLYKWSLEITYKSWGIIE